MPMNLHSQQCVGCFCATQLAAGEEVAASYSNYLFLTAAVKQIYDKRSAAQPARPAASQLQRNYNEFKLHKQKQIKLKLFVFIHHIARTLRYSIWNLRKLKFTILHELLQCISKHTTLFNQTQFLNTSAVTLQWKCRS